MSRKRKYSDEFRLKVVQEYLSGKNGGIYVIANKYKMKKLDKLVNKKTKDLQEQFEENEKLLKKVLVLEQNKNHYFVNLSHELRTPLNILTSVNQLIKARYSKESIITYEKLSYYLDLMDRNTDRLFKYTI